MQQQLDFIRTQARISDANFSHGQEITEHEAHLAVVHRNDLLDYVDELTRQLDDARTKAIDAGIFTSMDGEESRYTHALNTETCEGCGCEIGDEYCYRCETELSTPGATSYTP